MPAPLYSADDPCRRSGNSVSGVLDKFGRNYDRIMSLPQETKEEKESRHCIWLAEKEECERTYQTSTRPLRKATYIHFPEYIDPRLRDYRSRYGATSNDRRIYHGRTCLREGVSVLLMTTSIWMRCGGAGRNETNVID